jgi:hypothetical protein
MLKNLIWAFKSVNKKEFSKVKMVACKQQWCQLWHLTIRIEHGQKVGIANSHHPRKISHVLLVLAFEMGYNSMENIAKFYTKSHHP